ncbi:MAG TPA: hypothetical protein VFK68_12325, partial [Propionibacteriaceae bacterium]|nr:hypothetical protein [Propionibacteriaceae bacterium]
MRWVALVPLALALSGCAATQHVAATADGVLDLDGAVQLPVGGTVTRTDSPDPGCATAVYRLHTTAGDYEATA